jgi:uncharacterized protein (DUF1800 family)
MGYNNNEAVDTANEYNATTETAIKKGRDVTSTLAPYTGNFARNEIVHLLKRTMFGAKVADVVYFEGKTLSQTVAELLQPSAASLNPAPPVKEYTDNTTNGNVPDMLPVGTTWVNSITNDGTVQSQRRASLKKWYVNQALNQERSILEKMIWFWTNHFGVEIDIVGTANFAYKQHTLIRTNALGNFKNLVRDMSTDLAMLRYLNGYINVAAAPDENYARELQELFAVGKGPDSLYTENDVKEAAKVLTGWRINYNLHTVTFDSSRHSSVNKTFSAFYNNTTIQGRTGPNAGMLELNDLINMIFNTNEAAKFLVRKLYRWFVYSEIDQATESNIITPLANMLRANNYEVKPVLETLLKSEHFFDVQNIGAQIKSPMDLVLGACREFNVVFPNSTTEFLDAYGMWNYLHNTHLVPMQQNLHDPPDVSGWPAYYQEPAFYKIWVNTDTLPKRNIFTDTMITSGYTRQGKKIVFDAIAFAKLLPNPSDPNELISDAIKIMFRTDLSALSKQQLKTQLLLTNQAQDYYWTNAWNAYIATPNNANAAIVNTRLKDLFKYLMNLAEYQLC